jgi:hypothetical protein
MVITVAAFSGCAGIRGDGSAGSLPTGDAAAARSALPKRGTLFAAIFAGSLPGSVIFSAPPYVANGSTQPLRGPVNVALTKNDSLIVAGTALSTTAPLAVIEPPYTGLPTTVANVFWAGGMALDQNDDIFLVQRPGLHSNFTYFMEYLAPAYTKSIRFGGDHGRYIGSITALPNGALAVGSVRDGPHDSSLPGSLAIYHPPFNRAPSTIADLKFVSAMTVVPEGLIVLVCGECFGVKAAGTYIALVAAPYTSRTKVLVDLPNVTAPSLTSTAGGDIFVKQDGILYRYAPPYSKGEALPKTAGALESMTTAPNGDLFFGSTTGTGPRGQFAINVLHAPYTAQPQTIYPAFAPIAGMAVSK